MAARVIIDFETRSQLDLKKVGAARYAADPSTDVWCVGYAIDDQPVQLWRPGEPLPADLAAALADPDCLVIAHNAAFEIAILRGILTPRYGWPEIAIERWRDTMSAALASALPAALGKVAAVLGLSEQKGDKSIVPLMAKPRRPRSDEEPAAGPYWFDDAEHLQQLYDYCRQDVETERELYRRLPPLSPAEQELWQLDQAINSRGFYVDGVLVARAIVISTAADKAVQAELQRIANGEIESTSQVAKLLSWLAARGCSVEDAQKATLSAALRRTSLAPEVRRVIELRREAAHAAANKFPALRAWRCHDGRVRGSFKFHGAATGRWTGSGVQPQNFRRETENTEAKFAAVMSGNIEAVQQLGSPIEIVGDVARCAICAPANSQLLVADFSGVESCVTAWVADQSDKVAQWAKFFRTREPADDPYYLLGLALGLPKEIARERGKGCDLASCYQGGVNALRKFMPADADISEAELENYKRAWRARHPLITQFWWGVDRAAVQAVARPGAPVRYGRLSLVCEQIGEAPFLLVTLPSGRRLAYPCPKLITNRFGRPAVEFMDNSITNGGWVPCNAYGGLWTENIVQGIARDLLAEAMTRLDAAGYPVVLHVHDEVVCELPNGEGSLEEFRDLVTRLPDWAEGLPIGAKARNGARFAEIDAPVEHVAGATETVPLKLRQKQATRAVVELGPIVAGPPITDVGFNAADPRGRLVAWVIEREAIRKRKEAGQPWPWTGEPILRAGRFCNVYREHDRVTRWITTNIVERFRDDPDLWHAVTMARCINEPATLAELLPHLLPFDASQCLAILQTRQARGEKVFRTEAYKPPTPPTKGASTAEFLINEVLAPMWEQRETLRPQPGETLAAYSVRLEQRYRVGPFLSGQIIADLKHVAPLREATDWWTFARPGPGSERGLNRIRGRPVNASWSDAAWYRELLALLAEIAPLLAAASLAPLDAQNAQNCCCEFDKWERAREAGGKTARRYQPTADAAPREKRPKKTKAKAEGTEAVPAESATPLESGMATPPPIAEPVASVKFMITAQDKIGLRARGLSAEQIAELTPQAAADILAQPAPRAAVEPIALPVELLAAIDADEAQRAAATTQPVGVAAAPTATVKASPPPGGNGFSQERRRYSSIGESPHGKSGAPRGEVKTTFIYDHPDRPPPHFYLLVEKRLDTAGNRNFYQYRWENGRWHLGVKGTYAERKIPYRLPELKAALAINPNVEVQLAEGEKDAETLQRLGFVATTNPGGAAHWTDDLTAWLRVLGVRRIVIHEDNNEPGRERTKALNAALSDFATVRVARYTDTPEGEDVTYWIETLGHSKEDLAARIAAAESAKGAINFTDTPLSTQQWLTRDLAEADLLLGHVLSTSTRMLLFADTGLGKTHFTMAVSGHTGVGRNFLHWHCPRPARILYIDGEMSLKLFRERIADVARRLSGPPPGAYFFNKADVPGFAPLNTRDGQAAVWALIEEVERRSGQKLDAVCFDSIMALLLGDMKEEDAWRDTMPLVHALTARRIGQLWVHHTGHDTSHGYGTKTREWQMDTVARLEAIENTPPDIIAFRLSFPKARERTPANRLDFTEAAITLANDQWTGVLLSNARGKIEGLTLKFYQALVAATANSNVAHIGSYPTASLDEWRAQCTACGLLDPGKADSARSLFSRHRLKLLAANWVACSEELAWVLP